MTIVRYFVSAQFFDAADERELVSGIFPGDKFSRGIAVALRRANSGQPYCSRLHVDEKIVRDYFDVVRNAAQMARGGNSFWKNCRGMSFLIGTSATALRTASRKCERTNLLLTSVFAFRITAGDAYIGTLSEFAPVDNDNAISQTTGERDSRRVQLISHDR